MIKIIKNILVTLGVIFIGLLVLVVYLSDSANDFLIESEPFVVEFMQDLSTTWQVSDVSSRLTNEFIVQVDSDNGRRAMSTFAALGELVSVSDIELNHYNSTLGGVEAVFLFKANFENGEGVVTGNGSATVF